MREALQWYNGISQGYYELAREAEAALVRLEAVVEAARERPCNRFDITPCTERPELTEATWCPMCRALRALDEEPA